MLFKSSLPCIFKKLFLRSSFSFFKSSARWWLFWILNHPNVLNVSHNWLKCESQWVYLIEWESGNCSKIRFLFNRNLLWSQCSRVRNGLILENGLLDSPSLSWVSVDDLLSRLGNFEVDQVWLLDTGSSHTFFHSHHCVPAFKVGSDIRGV